jgi:hypothetical protein
MAVYNVMLEGREPEKGFLITFEVASVSESSAKKIALNEAKGMGLNIIGVEEVSFKRKLKPSEKPGILKVYGKAYFDIEDLN